VPNRAFVLSPSLRSIGVGVVPQGRGNVWVLYVMPPGGKFGTTVRYPGDGQKDVPIDFVGNLKLLLPKAKDDAEAGFPVTLTFSTPEKVTAPEASLTALTEKVPVGVILVRGRVSTQVVLIPRKPLALDREYTAEVAGKVGSKAYREKWTFQTMSEQYEEPAVVRQLLADLNAARKAAGLKPVAYDRDLSKACKLHAWYLQENLNHPKVRGVGVHTEDDSLKGYTKEGARVAKGAVIAVLPNPKSAVKTWLATLYHRIPLLSPSLKRIGYAQERHADGYIQVLDIARGR
jgi:uncharacterized protein YkwD